MGNLSKVRLGEAVYDVVDSAARESLGAHLQTFPSSQSQLTTLVETYVQTQDITFKRYKRYYSLVEGDYAQLVLGVDYDFGDTIDQSTVYERHVFTPLQAANLLNQSIGVVNTLITAHRATSATTADPEPEASNG